MRVRFGFSTSRWWISRLIKRFTGGLASHAFMLVDSGDFGGQLVLEAGWDGWRFSTPEALTSGTTRIVALVEPPPELAAAVVTATRKSREHLGEGYNYEGLAGMAWVELARRFLRKKVLNPLRNRNTVFCSEAVVEFILQPAGWPGADKLDAQSVSPADLLTFLMAHPGARTELFPAAA